jgi:carbamoyl-phosphate synthase large subunit
MPETILVLGSGPIRIGQGIEFDYSCVHCVWALEKIGYRAIVINNNPETVSTDFDTSDGLYFEPVTLPDVLAVVQHEKPIGVVCQFGGQTAINLAQPLQDAGVRVLGTSPESIAMAEDREQFDALLEEIGVPRPIGKAVRSIEEAAAVAAQVRYPVLVRPSFVLGGRAMEIVYDETQLREFYGDAESASEGQPVLIDQYLLGLETEVDVISDGESTLVPGIMEHIERAGVHSGDSMAVYPAVGLSINVQSQMVESACKIARALKIKGLMNIQFVIQNEIAYVLEVNPRASRTVPFLSKVTGIPMVDLGTRCMMGEKLADLGYESGLWCLEPSLNETAAGRTIPESHFIQRKAELPAPVLYAVKAPVFSFQKLRKVEPSLGPEMKSTGEIMGIDNDFRAALYKAMIASGIQFKGDGYVLISVKNDDKDKAVQMAQKFASKGYKIAATGGTHDALTQAGINSTWIMKISEGSPNLLDKIMQGEISILINSPSGNKQAEREAAQIRRACIETGVACITSIDTAEALADALELFADPSKSSCLRLGEYFQGKKVQVLA